MPETPKRYDLKQSWGGADMVRHETGDYVLWDDYEALSSALKEAQERARWIPVGERKPSQYELVNVANCIGVSCGRLVGYLWTGTDNRTFLHQPTHWMPLPEPPTPSPSQSSDPQPAKERQ